MWTSWSPGFTTFLTWQICLQVQGSSSRSIECSDGWEGSIHSDLCLCSPEPSQNWDVGHCGDPHCSALTPTWKDSLKRSVGFTKSLGSSVLRSHLPSYFIVMAVEALTLMNKCIPYSAIPMTLKANKSMIHKVYHWKLECIFYLVWVLGLPTQEFLCGMNFSSFCSCLESAPVSRYTLLDLWVLFVFFQHQAFLYHICKATTWSSVYTFSGVSWTLQPSVGCFGHKILHVAVWAASIRQILYCFLEPVNICLLCCLLLSWAAFWHPEGKRLPVSFTGQEWKKFPHFLSHRNNSR